MTTDEFREAIADLGYTQRGFAAYCGAGDRTVRRWASGDQDIPVWVSVIIALLRELKDAPGQRRPWHAR